VCVCVCACVCVRVCVCACVCFKSCYSITQQLSSDFFARTLNTPQLCVASQERFQSKKAFTCTKETVKRTDRQTDRLTDRRRRPTRRPFPFLVTFCQTGRNLAVTRSDERSLSYGKSIFSCHTRDYITLYRFPPSLRAAKMKLNRSEPAWHSSNSK